VLCCALRWGGGLQEVGAGGRSERVSE
jgi:hypothetical protein